jgi:hypothetical protein
MCTTDIVFRFCRARTAAEMKALKECEAGGGTWRDGSLGYLGSCVATGGEPRPTKEACEKMFRNLIALKANIGPLAKLPPEQARKAVAKTFSKTMREAYIFNCERNMTAARVECMTAATSAKAFMECK